MKTDQTAAVNILAELAELCEAKRIKWEVAAELAKDAAPAEAHRLRYDRNVAHGEHLGAIEALYAARKVLNELLGLPCSCGHGEQEHGKYFKQRPCTKCDCVDVRYCGASHAVTAN